MQYLIIILSLLAFKARAIDFVLFEDNDCDTEDEESKLCVDLDYNECCGGFSNSNGGELYGAAAVSMGSTEIQNTPTLRSYIQGGEPLMVCGTILASETLANDPNNPGTFPCAEGPAPMSYNGFNVESIVTSSANQKRESPRRVVEPNGWGIFENGTIYGIKSNSPRGQLFDELKGRMTKKERRSFIKTYAENTGGANAKLFRG